MKILKTINEVKSFVSECKSLGKTIGLVPTMGYLHDGHKSLIKTSSAQNDITIVSIFVNPTQFGVNEDLDTYPRDLAHDTKVAIDGGATVIFSPSISEMYPNGYNTYVNVEEITSILCGKSRPIHFRGVATVV
ncbi:MAG: pantoate--beta-alanine ligase, partial [Oscillospiraceae bacterium]